MAAGVVLAGILPAVTLAQPAHAAGATYTATNSKVDGKGHCKNGGTSKQDPVNCNIYDGKQYVWLNAGPAGAALPDGSYFFAVLAPGGQHDPNDGSPKLLSSDAVGDRSFSVTGGVITYGGPHSFNSNKIRLMPYADTPNPGGVYILAICRTPHPAVPSQCKYDAFKVKPPLEPPAQVNAVFSGTKWLDDSSADGVLGLTETGLQGWTIRIYKDNVLVASPETDPNGEWTWTEPAHAVTTGSATYTVCETLQSAWRQTGPTSAAAVSTSGGAVASLTGTLADGTRCYSISAPNDTIATAGSVDFFNIRQGSIAGGKYYDLNEDGTWTSGETGIDGWRIQVSKDPTFATGVSNHTTSGGGLFSLAGMDPGTYYVREAQSGGWVQTGNVSYQGTSSAVSLSNKVYTYVVSATGSTPAADSLFFGNVCRTTPGGHTLGFWHNKNGQDLITEANLAALRGFNLVSENGSAFDPWTKAQLSTWLVEGNASNMAYMLSVQMTATYLSTQHGFTNDVVVVDGTRTVAQEITYANGLLAANPVTVLASAERTEQGRVKSIFDKINNNGAFPAATATGCPTPTFP